MSFKIIKSDGRKEDFNPKKINDLIIRIGGNKKTAKHIIQKIQSKYSGKEVPSQEIFYELKDILKKEKPILAKKYNLKKAILKLGPTGFEFEKYVASVLRVYGYKAELPSDYQGACVTHEVDVTVEKDGRTAMIEAKFRNKPNDYIRIKDTMSTWARFLDLVDGSKLGQCPHFDEVWIVTNARFSKQSLQYAHCKNMVMIGWNHPRERTFARMIDLQSMYPITILDNVSSHEFRTLAQHNIMLCSEVIKQEPETLRKMIPIKPQALDNIISQCEELLTPEKQF